MSSLREIRSRVYLDPTLEHVGEEHTRGAEIDRFGERILLAHRAPSERFAPT
jgi:hypothetical protein